MKFRYHFKTCLDGKRIEGRYRDAFSYIKGFGMPETYEGDKSGYHLFTIRVNPIRRDIILKGLQEKGIGIEVNYRAIHLLTKFAKLFGKTRGSFPVSERIGDSTISLPFYPRLEDAQTDYVVAGVREAVGEFSQ